MNEKIAVPLSDTNGKIEPNSENACFAGEYPVTEDDIAQRVFSERFDGVLMINPENRLLIKFSERLCGKLASYFRFDGTSYDAQIAEFINAHLPDEDRESLLKLMLFDTVTEKLAETGRTVYTVDMFIVSGKHRRKKYKRITYERLVKADASSPIMLTCEDISDILESETDPVTGLCSAMSFYRRVKEWIDTNPGKKYRIQRYDIGRFRNINGVYGYAMGNRILRDFGMYMKKYDDETSFSAHLSADHFVRFCGGESKPVQWYYGMFKSAFAKYDLTIPITVHVGVYDLCEPDCDPFTMSYKALLALQSVKGSLSHRIAYYEKGLMDSEKKQQELLAGFDRAVKNEEFEIWFQPQVDYKNGVMTGAEALIRWRHPTRGLLSPSSFIPLLERSDCIGTVDEYMFRKACAFVRKRLDKAPDKPVRVSVNLSSKDIYKRDLCDTLKNIAESYELPPNCIHIELTESAYTESPELLAEAAGRLREAGFIIEMDDFGSGYSSLNILKDIDIDILKLDMKFLSGGPESRKGEIIVSSIVNMAKKLRIPVIAEGVETKVQADMLLSFGCTYMQGYYFSKPLPESEYEKLLDKGGLFGKTKDGKKKG